MEQQFSIDELQKMKNSLVRCGEFELAAKCRGIEKSHPDYVKPKKKRASKNKGKWILTAPVGTCIDINTIASIEMAKKIF